MQKLRQHIYFAKQVPLVLFALFALASCSVKEPFFEALDTDYQRPLSQTKATLQVEHSCHSSEKAIPATFKNNQVDALKLLALSNSDRSWLIKHKPEVVEHPVVCNTPNKTQPLYILYKRLKFDLHRSSTPDTYIL